MRKGRRQWGRQVPVIPAPEGDTDLNSGGLCREQQGAEDPGYKGLTHRALAPEALEF